LCALVCGTQNEEIYPKFVPLLHTYPIWYDMNEHMCYTVALCCVLQLFVPVRVCVWCNKSSCWGLCCVVCVCVFTYQIKGVTLGFNYKMRLVYAHFPITAKTANGGKSLILRNYLGEHVVKTLHMPEGVTIERSEDVKDELQIKGIEIDKVGQTGLFCFVFGLVFVFNWVLFKV